MKRRQNAFTLVEMIVVIVIIGILATVVTLGLTKYQQNSRDAQRQASVTNIAEALEKYYDQNGEYPNCSALTAAPSQVSSETLKGIDQNALRAPLASTGTTNSLICGDLAESNTNDVFAYTATGPSCTASSGACISWVIKYREESTGQITTIQSRHIQTAGNPTDPTSNVSVSAAMSGTSAVGTASANACAAGASLEYRFRTRSTNTSSDGTWSAWGAWSTSNKNTISSTNEGTLYAFQTQARCSSKGMSSDAVESTVASVTRSISAPTSTSLSATMSGANAVGSASATCAAGTTTQYRLATMSRNTTTGGTWPAWSDWATNATTSVASAAQGYQHNFDAQARCMTARATSSITEYATASVVRPISTPSAPTASITVTSPSGQSDVTYTAQWSGSSCPAGTTLWYSYAWLTSYRMSSQAEYLPTAANRIDFRYLAANLPGGPDGSVGPYYRYANMSRATGTTVASTVKSATRTDEQGSRSGIEVRTNCNTPFAQSDWSATSAAARITAGINAPTNPAAPTSFTRTLSSDRKSLTTSWTSPKCSTTSASTPNGYTSDGAYRFRWTGGGYVATSFGSWAGLSIPYGASLPMSFSSALLKGGTYEVSVTSRCGGDYNETAWLNQTTAALSIP